MNDNICTKLKWLQQPWGVKCAIQHQWHTSFGRYLGYSFDIHNIKPGVANHLTKHDFRIWLDGSFNGGHICWVDKAGGNAKSRQCVFK